MKHGMMVLAASVAGAMFLSGCSAAKCSMPCTARPSNIEHVVLIGIDGFGADYIPWDSCPNLNNLRSKSLYTVGRCDFPTASAINWASSMMGTTVEMHGYRKWNSKKPDVPAWQLTDKGMPPDIFSEIRRQRPDAYTTSCFDWDGIGFIHQTQDVCQATYFTGDTKEEDLTKAFNERLAKKPTFGFLYYGSVDTAGHKFGWGSLEQTNAIVKVDALIGKMLDTLEKSDIASNTAVMLIADHGGKGKKHGQDDIECFRIPFLVYFPGVRDAYVLKEPCMIADTAPTIAWLLGLDVLEGWRGRPALKSK